MAAPQQMPKALRLLINGVQILAAGAALLVLVYLFWPQFQAATAPREPALPSSMQAVDWHDPESSKYCLACHEQVGLVSGGLAVTRGHSQNVKLSSEQLAAVEQMNAVAGTEGRLICMSCHQLGQDADTQYMLAGSLAGSELCQNCHPGHYAQGTPHDLRLSAPEETNRIGQTVAEGGPCSACHLAHSYAREIQAGPLDPEGYCLPCHSQYHVAEAHAHTRMEHPEARCRECHDPHNDSHGAFLAQAPTPLCVSCHEGYDAGRAGGMHPVGQIDSVIPVALEPKELAEHEDPHDLSCVVCHDTHEAPFEGLLRLRPDANELCLRCHEDKLLDKSHTGVLPKHGQQPVLTAAQTEVVSHWGNPVGPNNELLCISCHSVHASLPGTQLLSFRPQYGETCVACHPDQRSVAGSVHDLRTNFPDLPNNAGMTPVEAGACSACHLAHEFPRERVITPADPSGQCMTCHHEDGCGASVAGADHPDTACVDCHDPHTRRTRAFLTADTPQLCLNCHETQIELIGGPHDIAQNPDAWPAEAVEAGGKCLPCHVAHGGDRPDLYRFNAPTEYGMHDGVCMSCHPDAAWGAESTIAAIHPQQVEGGRAHVDLALVPTDRQGEKRLGCRTCHAPHGGAAPRHLARVQPGESTEQLCLHCHEEKTLIRMTGHSPNELAAAGYDTDSCKPCHAMHATPDGTWGKVLSPRFLMEYCEVEQVGATGCVPCLACHQNDGPAPQRRFYEHPETPDAYNPLKPSAPAYMPLFGPDGKESESGQVTCRTCHLSHGRVDLLERLAADEELTEGERHNMRAQVRSFIEPNVCTTCHGNVARALYLFFHEPERRSGIKTHGKTPRD